ncbi:Uncharacterized damage-inducible protein DinB (forms a four-helix bundle) [Amphibacillus marinus]|uniref:Uncharacterized damage-inducible protein DinB (Forms a four-helix bundle) n=1 Tax=Amphibacillus marinus TaxID=872970 RepID=A0A1H8KGR5_9BACI|nr:DinB family protein [Amphibacillus marinus]SEN92170.1 Uncharacterized damage-inducible protein DinB (forms a four-helix bundle) [Amphibacillus marinus]
MELSEYQWVKQTRKHLLDQCKVIANEDLNKYLGFGFGSIKDMLCHVAECYHAWLGSFVLDEVTKPVYSKQEIDNMSITDIERYFYQADHYVEKVLSKSSSQQGEQIKRQLPWSTEGDVVSRSAIQLVMHAVTHEFHHKGQIAMMLRLLGYIPRNTDVIRCEE